MFPLLHDGGAHVVVMLIKQLIEYITPSFGSCGYTRVIMWFHICPITHDYWLVLLVY